MLSSGKKLVMLALVALATSAGILFAKRTPPADAPDEGASRQSLARRLPDHPAGTGSNAPGSPVLGSPKFTVPTVVGPTVAGPRHLIAADDDAGLRMPTAATPGNADPGAGFTFGPQNRAPYARTFNPAGAMLTPQVARVESPVEFSEEPELPIGRPAAGSGPRTHTVVDGDTLSALAVRYLGSSDRYREIFAANRQVLASPDLLPIGAVLQMPPAQPGAEAPQQPAESRLPESRLPESRLPESRLPESQPAESRLPELQPSPTPARLDGLVPVPKGVLHGDDQ